MGTQKVELLAEGEAYKATPCPTGTAGLRERTFDSPGCSAVCLSHGSNIHSAFSLRYELCHQGDKLFPQQKSSPRKRWIKNSIWVSIQSIRWFLLHRNQSHQNCPNYWGQHHTTQVVNILQLLPARFACVQILMDSGHLPHHHGALTRSPHEGWIEGSGLSITWPLQPTRMPQYSALCFPHKMKQRNGTKDCRLSTKPSK